MGTGSAELCLQAFHRPADRAQRIFEEIFRRGLPRTASARGSGGGGPVLSAEAPDLLLNLKALEGLLQKESDDSSQVVQMRVNLLFARGIAARLREQSLPYRDGFLRDTLPTLWWIDGRFGYNPFEYLDEALDEDELNAFWGAALQVLVALAESIDPPRERTVEELLRDVAATVARDLTRTPGEWPVLTRGLYRFVQQPEERYPHVAALLGCCRSASALSYVSSLDAVRNNPRLLARLMEGGSAQAAMVALVAYARSDRDVAVRRLVRRHLAVTAHPLPLERLASLYGWLDALGDPDPALSQLLVHLSAQQVRTETDEGRAPVTALTVADGHGFRAERLYGELARHLDGASRQIASRRVIECLQLRLGGGAVPASPLDPQWPGRMAQAVRNACAPFGRTERAMVPVVLGAVQHASDTLARHVPRDRVAIPAVEAERFVAFSELLVLLARRLPADPTGRDLSIGMLGAALANYQQRAHLLDGLPSFLVLEHLVAREGPGPLVRDALSLAWARPFLERWRALERGEADLSGPSGQVDRVVPMGGADLRATTTFAVPPVSAGTLARLVAWMRRALGH